MLSSSSVPLVSSFTALELESNSESIRTSRRCQCLFGLIRKESKEIHRAWKTRHPLLCNLTLEEYTPFYKREKEEVLTTAALARTSVVNPIEGYSNDHDILSHLPIDRYFYDVPYSRHAFRCECSYFHHIISVYLTVTLIFSVLFPIYYFYPLLDISYSDIVYHSFTQSNITIHIQDHYSFYQFDSHATGISPYDINQKITYFDYSNIFDSICTYTTYSNIIADNISESGNQNIPDGIPIPNSLPVCKTFLLSRTLIILSTVYCVIFAISHMYLFTNVHQTRFDYAQLKTEIESPPLPLKRQIEEIYHLPTEEEQFEYVHKRLDKNKWLVNYAMFTAMVSGNVSLILCQLTFIFLHSALKAVSNSTSSWSFTPICVIMALVSLFCLVLDTLYYTFLYKLVGYDNNGPALRNNR